MGFLSCAHMQAGSVSMRFVSVPQKLNKEREEPKVLRSYSVIA